VIFRDVDTAFWVPQVTLPILQSSPQPGFGGALDFEVDFKCVGAPVSLSFVQFWHLFLVFFSPFFGDFFGETLVPFFGETLVPFFGETLVTFFGETLVPFLAPFSSNGSRARLKLGFLWFLGFVSQHFPGDRFPAVARGTPILLGFL
jgi:hypothetical protein